MSDIETGTREKLLELNKLFVQMDRMMNWESEAQVLRKSIDEGKEQIERDNPGWLVWRVNRSYVLSPMGATNKGGQS